MTEIEKRLKALEKRARIDDERWQMLDAQMKAIDLIFTAIGAPIGAANPVTLRAIITNLRTYEDIARVQNEHAMTIRQLRRTRIFFESRMKGGKTGDSGQASTNDDKPHRRK